MIIVFLVPYAYHIDNGPGPNMTMAILWDVSNYYGFQVLQSLQYFPYYILRIIVLYEIFRLFQEKVSRKKLIIIAIISELIPLILTIPGVLILNSEGEGYVPVMISIPMLLLFVAFLVTLFPRINQIKLT
jgi:hypothetical protein